MATALVDLPVVERLSPRVIRVLGGNPSKVITLPSIPEHVLKGTNTYLVGTGRERLLLDTGEGKPAWAASLKKVLAEENATISQTVLSHWHHDHVGGVKDVQLLVPSCPVYKNQPRRGEHDILHGQTFTTEGATLKAFHCPGHTADHMAFVLLEEDAMFTGDNVLGQGTAVFEDLKTYMESLESMSTAFAGRAYPGHGPVLEDGNAKVKEYITHRRDREEQIIRVLTGQAGDEKTVWGSMELVKVIYKDYPEYLHGPAEGSVLQVLKKLEQEGKVRHEGDRWTSVHEVKL